MPFDPSYPSFAARLSENGDAAEAEAIASALDPEPEDSASTKGGYAVRRDQPQMVCPVTGLRFSYNEGKYRNGSLVHPLAYDEPGYREMPLNANTPEPLRRPERPRFAFWNPR
jgi:hypothetical protein